MSSDNKVPVSNDRIHPSRFGNPFLSLQRDIDRLFGDFTRSLPDFGHMTTTDFAPNMNVSETDSEIELSFEMPGLTDKDVEIDLSDNVLTVHGEKKDEHEEKDEKRNYRLVERSYGWFSRSVELPSGVDPDAIVATVTDGVLRVRVPKPEPVETRHIGIRADA